MRLRRAASLTPIVPIPEHVSGWDSFVASDEPPAVIKAQRADELLLETRQVA